jgi:surface-adhesin protein E
MKLLLVLLPALFACLAVAQTASEPSSPWTLDYKSDEGCLDYVDTASIAIHESYKKMWVMSSCDKPRPSANSSSPPFSSEGRLYYFNCSEQTMLLAQTVRYADHFGRGAMTDRLQVDVKPEAFAPAAPDTVAADWLRLVCSGPATSPASDQQKPTQTSTVP